MHSAPFRLAAASVPDLLAGMTANREAFQVVPKIRIHVGRKFLFGPGRAELLEQIARHGSIGAAATAMAMSYMKAWKLVQSMERDFPEPLVTRRRGGHQRGGAGLTDTGRQVLELYREMEAAAAATVREPGRRLESLLGRSASPARSRPR